MRITKLIARGLKGLDFTHELAAVNVIVGANFKGKTARIDGLRLALMGYLPELGKTGPATMTLGNGELMVGIRTDQGPHVSRSWEARGKAVKATVDGELPETPGVLMNAAEYFEMGDKDRIRYVFSLATVEAPEFTADAIITAVKVVEVEGHSEHHERVIGRLVETIDASDRARHEAGQSIQDWVEALCVEMRGKLTLARAGQKRMSETVRGQTTLTAGEETTQTRDCEAELKAATTESGVLRGTIDALTRDIRRLDGVAEQRAALDQRIAGAVDVSEHIKAAEDELAERQKVVHKPDSDLVNKITAAEKELAGLRTNSDAYTSKQATVAAKLRKASDEQAAARSNVDQASKEIARLRSEHAVNLSKKECPHCGARKAGWQDSIIAKFDARLTELNQKMLDAENRLEAARKTVVELEHNLKTEQAADEQHQHNARKVTTLQGTVNDLRSQQAAIGQSFEVERVCIQEYVNGLKAQQSAIDQARATLAGMEPVDQDKIDELNVTIAAKGKDAARLDEQVIDLTRRQRAYLQWRQDEARNAQAILAGLEVTAEVEVLKAVVAILEALQVAMVKKAFETILERANQVTKGIMLTPLEYHDGEIGRFQGGQWISHRTFSGTEKALTYAGISVALAWDAPIKIVLMDELGRIDAEHQGQLIQRMIQLTESGAIDQFVGAATVWPENEKGLNVIRL